MINFSNITVTNGGVVLKKNSKKLLLSAILLCLFLSGCGKKNQELTEYQENMTTFYEQVSTISASIEAIDPASETATADLLSNLDLMSEQFQYLSEMTVPKEFENVESLANDASSYMSQAVELYHEAYSNGSYNEYTAQAAYEYYARAMTRISYISDLLQGKIPDDANVVVTTGEATEFEVPTETDAATETPETTPVETSATETTVAE